MTAFSNGYLPAKFGSRSSICMKCSLFQFVYVLNKVQRFARALHVQWAAHVKYLYDILRAFSKCTNVPSLVSPVQKFTNSDEPVQIKLFASSTCRLYSSVLANTKASSQPWWLPAHWVWFTSALAWTVAPNNKNVQGFTRQHVARSGWDQLLRN